MSTRAGTGEGITIREGILDDLDSIVALERATEFAPHWGRAVYRDLLARSGGRVPRLLVVAESVGGGEAGRQLVGFAVGVIQSEGVAELESVAVARGVRRAGVGSALCQAVIRWSQERGVREVLLEVRSTSSAASALYVRLGFIEIARRPRYYTDPTDDAVVMKLLLTADSSD